MVEHGNKMSAGSGATPSSLSNLRLLEERGTVWSQHRGRFAAANPTISEQIEAAISNAKWLRRCSTPFPGAVPGPAPLGVLRKTDDFCSRIVGVTWAGSPKLA